MGRIMVLNDGTRWSWLNNCQILDIPETIDPDKINEILKVYRDTGFVLLEGISVVQTFSENVVIDEDVVNPANMTDEDFVENLSAHMQEDVWPNYDLIEMQEKEDLTKED